MSRLPLLEIDENVFIQAEKIVAVKHAGEDNCFLWFAGESQVNGVFLLHRPAGDVVKEINDYLAEEPD